MALWARWWEGEGRSDADTMRRCPLSSVGGSPRLRGGAVSQRAGEGRGWRCPLLVKSRSASSVP